MIEFGLAGPAGEALQQAAILREMSPKLGLVEIHLGDHAVEYFFERRGTALFQLHGDFQHRDSVEGILRLRQRGGFLGFGGARSGSLGSSAVGHGLSLGGPDAVAVEAGSWLYRCISDRSDEPSTARTRRTILTDTRYMVIEGPIGVGKTSLANILVERLNARQVLETVEENPFLGRFYGDRRKYAFQTQLFFLLSRFQQQQELFQQDLFSSVTVSDYLFAKDRIFASLNLDPHELGLYDRIFQALGPRVAKPDLVIFLQARLEVLIQRIRKRGREFERQLEPAYLGELIRAYNDYFFHYSETPLLVVNTSDIDFINNEQDLEHLLGMIRKMRRGTQHYNPVGTKL